MTIDAAVPDDQLEALYNQRLDAFVAACLELAEIGQPYMAVLLCHELVRYLYPVEPVAGFAHHDPARFLVGHIARLLELADAARRTTRGYRDALTNWTRAAAPEAQVETRTSDLYTELWSRFTPETLLRESRRLIEQRLPAEVIAAHITDRSVLDLGCGSGRYAIALAALGARSVTAVDFQEKSYQAAAALCADHKLPVAFQTVDVLSPPFDDRAFDFVFSNGVLHHTRDWRRGLAEYCRVMGRSGYLYLYGAGGFFWNTRTALRRIFAVIPAPYAQAALAVIGVPANRFIFMDTWYVPIEEHITQDALREALATQGVHAQTLETQVPYDLDHAAARRLPNAALTWGCGEHRLLITKAD